MFFRLLSALIVTIALNSVPPMIDEPPTDERVETNYCVDQDCITRCYHCVGNSCVVFSETPTPGCTGVIPVPVE